MFCISEVEAFEMACKIIGFKERELTGPSPLLQCVPAPKQPRGPRPNCREHARASAPHNTRVQSPSDRRSPPRQAPTLPPHMRHEAAYPLPFLDEAKHPFSSLLPTISLAHPLLSLPRPLPTLLHQVADCLDVKFFFPHCWPPSMSGQLSTRAILKPLRQRVKSHAIRHLFVRHLIDDHLVRPSSAPPSYLPKHAPDATHLCDPFDGSPSLVFGLPPSTLSA
jgi:hypothetical protein